MATEARTVEVRPEDYSYVFNPYREPIERVSPGEVLVLPDRPQRVSHPGVGCPFRERGPGDVA